jgi:triacylglycerol lipase
MTEKRTFLTLTSHSSPAKTLHHCIKRTLKIGLKTVTFRLPATRNLKANDFCRLRRTVVTSTPQGPPTPGLLPPTWKNLFYPPERDQYTYFAYASQYPFGRQTPEGVLFDPARAAWAADAAMLAYGRFGATPMAVEETHSILGKAGFTQHELIGNWTPDVKGTQGFFTSNNDFAILSFRGTERGDFGDLIWDMEPLTMAEPPVANGRGAFRVAARVAAFLEQRLMRECVVHEGFQRALETVWPEAERMLNAYRAAHPGAEICFTGHSLGAALATLAISRFSGGSASLYTFGCPRVGNAVFCNRVHERAELGAFRFVNENDLVTHVPIEAPFYHHAPQLAYHIQPGGTMVPFECGAMADLDDLNKVARGLRDHWRFLDLNTEAPGPLVDHSPARYCMQIRNHLVGQSGPGPRAAEAGCGPVEVVPIR